MKGLLSFNTNYMMSVLLMIVYNHAYILKHAKNFNYV